MAFVIHIHFRLLQDSIPRSLRRLLPGLGVTAVDVRFHLVCIYQLDIAVRLLVAGCFAARGELVR